MMRRAISFVAWTKFVIRHMWEIHVLGLDENQAGTSNKILWVDPRMMSVESLVVENIHFLRNIKSIWYPLSLLVSYCVCSCVASSMMVCCPQDISDLASPRSTLFSLFVSTESS